MLQRCTSQSSQRAGLVDPQDQIHSPCKDMGMVGMVTTIGWVYVQVMHDLVAMNLLEGQDCRFCTSWEAKTAQKTLQQSGLDTRKKHGFWAIWPQTMGWAGWSRFGDSEKRWFHGFSAWCRVAKNVQIRL